MLLCFARAKGVDHHKVSDTLGGGKTTHPPNLDLATHPFHRPRRPEVAPPTR